MASNYRPAILTLRNVYTSVVKYNRVKDNLSPQCFIIYVPSARVGSSSGWSCANLWCPLWSLATSDNCNFCIRAPSVLAHDKCLHWNSFYIHNMVLLNKGWSWCSREVTINIRISFSILMTISEGLQSMTLGISTTAEDAKYIMKTSPDCIWSSFHSNCLSGLIHNLLFHPKNIH